MSPNFLSSKKNLSVHCLPAFYTVCTVLNPLTSKKPPASVRTFASITHSFFYFSLQRPPLAPIHDEWRPILCWWQTCIKILHLMGGGTPRNGINIGRFSPAVRTLKILGPVWIAWPHLAPREVQQCGRARHGSTCCGDQYSHMGEWRRPWEAVWYWNGCIAYRPSFLSSSDIFTKCSM